MDYLHKQKVMHKSIVFCLHAANDDQPELYGTLFRLIGCRINGWKNSKNRIWRVKGIESQVKAAKTMNIGSYGICFAILGVQASRTVG